MPGGSIHSCVACITFSVFFPLSANSLISQVVPEEERPIWQCCLLIFGIIALVIMLGVLLAYCCARNRWCCFKRTRDDEDDEEDLENVGEGDDMYVVTTSVRYHITSSL